MVQLSQSYEVSDLPQERTGFDPLPPATYIAMVTDSKTKETKSGGQMIVLEIDVQEGDYAGRKLFENLNIKNANPKAEKMAFESLGELSHAIGLTGKLTDTEQLHNKRFQMTLKVKPAAEYDYTDTETGIVSKRMGNAQNTIAKFFPMSSVKTAVKGTTETKKPATAPWKEKASAK